MRILFVSHICPWPLRNGTRQRIFYLLSGLAERHTVTAVIPLESQEDAEAIPELDKVCAKVIPVRHGDDYRANKVRFNDWGPVQTRAWNLVSRREPLFVMQPWSEAVMDALTRLRSDAPFDAMWVERATNAAMARRAGFTRFVTDLDSLEAVGMMRALELRRFYWSKPVHLLEAAKAWGYERRLAGLNGPVVVCKDEDRQLFGRRAIRVRVVPNGVPELPLADRLKAVEGRMLFVGDMNYEPNVDAVLYFRGEILPRIREQFPKAHLVVVGRGHSHAIAGIADGDWVIYDGEIPELDRYFDEAGLFVVPMRRGGGTRLKVLEALARGMAVVSTSIGAEGIDVLDGIDYEKADSPSMFAAACALLLTDPVRRASIGSSGRARVAANYSWSRAVAAAEAALTASTT